MEQQLPVSENGGQTNGEKFYSVREIAAMKRLSYSQACELMHQTPHVLFGKRTMRATLADINETIRRLKKRG